MLVPNQKAQDMQQELVVVVVVVDRIVQCALVVVVDRIVQCALDILRTADSQRSRVPLLLQWAFQKERQCMRESLALQKLHLGSRSSGRHGDSTRGRRRWHNRSINHDLWHPINADKIMIAEAQGCESHWQCDE